MTSKSGPSVAAWQRLPELCFDMPVKLSFTRFVAAHGGSDSLRATDRPPVSKSRDPLTFTRHLWLVTDVPGRAGRTSGNGEEV